VLRGLNFRSCDSLEVELLSSDEWGRTGQHGLSVPQGTTVDQAWESSSTTARIDWLRLINQKLEIAIGLPVASVGNYLPTPEGFMCASQLNGGVARVSPGLPGLGLDRSD